MDLKSLSIKLIDTDLGVLMEKKYSAITKNTNDEQTSFIVGVSRLYSGYPELVAHFIEIAFRHPQSKFDR
ncbi:hypothetical protein GCM10020008_13020 [Lentilactobacillus kefiri DSM 20587 = JCM 5818]|uniref:Uncharacterized protein n=1 Tax=Lentilactobacillus kefiri TaxID=33962 RepID=A0A511DVQ5_LENKE|nr:hypothetical protein LKE01_17400 [Lentilactobacillus kefiri]